MKKAEIQYQDRTAGWLLQDEEGYHFIYDVAYLASENPKAISFTLPLKATAYTSKTMVPFFDGLIPEGWLLDIAERNWKLDPRDRGLDDAYGRSGQNQYRSPLPDPHAVRSVSRTQVKACDAILEMGEGLPKSACRS